MAKIYLVRHGEATAHWSEDTDPGLSTLGTEQAHGAASRLMRLGPLPIYSSPMRRARETAMPLELAWQATASIVHAVTEIPTPPIPHAQRNEWINGLMHGGWRGADQGLRDWRDALLAFLATVNTDAVIFSHYVAINAAVGHALARDDVYVFRPRNASITIIENEAGTLRLLERGDEVRPSAPESCPPPSRRS